VARQRSDLVLYLLSKEPIPFDLLFWKSDSTRMPAAMHSFCLRNMCQRNLLSKPPAFLLSMREDHIEPWKSTYTVTHLDSGPVIRFVGVRHMAGVISAPGGKHGHWTNDTLPATADECLPVRSLMIDPGGSSGTNGSLNSSLGGFPQAGLLWKAAAAVQAPEKSGYLHFSAMRKNGGGGLDPLHRQLVISPKSIRWKCMGRFSTHVLDAAIGR
jgi:hypothetical protein